MIPQIQKNIYGESKLEGEIAMRDIAPDNSIIIRTSWYTQNMGKTLSIGHCLDLEREQKEVSI